MHHPHGKEACNPFNVTGRDRAGLAGSINGTRSTRRERDRPSKGANDFVRLGRTKTRRFFDKLAALASVFKSPSIEEIARAASEESDESSGEGKEVWGCCRAHQSSMGKYRGRARSRKDGGRNRGRRRRKSRDERQQRRRRLRIAPEPAKLTRKLGRR